MYIQPGTLCYGGLSVLSGIGHLDWIVIYADIFGCAWNWRYFCHFGRGIMDKYDTQENYTNWLDTSSLWTKGALPIIGDIFGSFAGGFIASEIGRINTLFFCGLPTIVCFIIICAANNLWYIYVAMFFGALSNSAAYAIVGEISAIRTHLVHSKPKSSWNECTYTINFRHLYIRDMSQKYEKQVGSDSRPIHVFWYTSGIFCGILHRLEKSMPRVVLSCLSGSFLASNNIWNSLLALLERKKCWCRVRITWTFNDSIVDMFMEFSGSLWHSSEEKIMSI